MSYSKGPWTVKSPPKDTNAFDVYTKDGARIARGYWGFDSKANAHLLSAAPELFEVLFDLLNTPELNADEMDDDTRQDIDKAFSILKKATGTK